MIQLVKLKGAYVVAKVGSREKESLVKELGADFVVNYNEGDYIKKIKDIDPLLEKKLLIFSMKILNIIKHAPIINKISKDIELTR